MQKIRKGYEVHNMNTSIPGCCIIIISNKQDFHVTEFKFRFLKELPGHFRFEMWNKRRVFLILTGHMWLRRDLYAETYRILA